MVTGNRLKELREIAGLTLKEVGNALGVTDGAIWKLENKGSKKVKVNQDYWAKMATLYNCPIELFHPEYETGTIQTVISSGKGSVAQAAGRDASVISTDHQFADISPVDKKLFSLILEVAPESYKKNEIAKLQKIKDMISE